MSYGKIIVVNEKNPVKQVNGSPTENLADLRILILIHGFLLLKTFRIVHLNPDHPVDSSMTMKAKKYAPKKMLLHRPFMHPFL